SGTVAAAREAAFWGVPAIAASLAVEFVDDFADRVIDYQASARIVANLLQKGVCRYIPRGFLLNINFPYNVPHETVAHGHVGGHGIKITNSGFRRYNGDIERIFSPRGHAYYWMGVGCSGYEDIDNSDCQCVDQHQISITPMGFPDTQYPHRSELQEIISMIG
ncbi:MAG: hypothetical protein HQK53_13790, partial [Oligoflexia bacterium]|nr:hypothetical protein [Oligoflexia bacterium]